MRRVLLLSISALCFALVVSVGLALYTGVRTDAAVVGVVSVPVEKVLCHRFAG